MIFTGYCTTDKNIHVCGYISLEYDKSTHRVIYNYGNDNDIKEKKLYYTKDNRKYFMHNGKRVHIKQ